MESPEIWIAPGWSAAGTLWEALRPARGTLLVHQDVLSHGPLPRLEPLDRWREVRESYLRTLTEAGREVLAGSANFIDLVGIAEWVGGIHLDSARFGATATV